MEDDSIETKLEKGKLKWESFRETFHPPTNKREGNRAEAKRIVSVIRELNLPCPLTYYFMKEESVRAGFANLKSYVGEWTDKSHDEIKAHSGNWWLPSLFRGKPRQYVTNRLDWWKIDVIVDWFTEYERVCARKEYAHSPEEDWNKNKSLTKIVLLCSKKGIIDCASLRDGVYSVGRELGLFRCTRAKSLIEEIIGSKDLKGKRWLDMSSGWGDRLLTACALEMDYLGFDPNQNLKYGHDKMIKMFGNGRQTVCYKPFQIEESENLIKEDVISNGLFDISLISPPYYIIERYRGEGQSTETYPDLDDWIVKFLFKSLSLIWHNLKEGGYLAINMANIRDCDIIGPMQLFIEDFLSGCQWEGILTFAGKGLQDPLGTVYVWKKMTSTKKLIWNPKVNRSLKRLFPVLENLWLRKEEPVENFKRLKDSIEEKTVDQNDSD